MLQMAEIWPHQPFQREGPGNGVVTALTPHFVARWRERVGSEPSIDQVNRMIGEGLKIRRQILVYRLRRGIYEPYKMLAEYWVYRMGIIIKVDEDWQGAVTVITPECMWEAVKRWNRKHT